MTEEECPGTFVGTCLITETTDVLIKLKLHKPILFSKSPVSGFDYKIKFLKLHVCKIQYFVFTFTFNTSQRLVFEAK